jgi:hypothetical protein
MGQFAYHIMKIPASDARGWPFYTHYTHLRPSGWIVPIGSPSLRRVPPLR